MLSCSSRWLSYPPSPKGPNGHASRQLQALCRMKKLLDHSAVSHEQQQELLDESCAGFAARGHRTQHICRVIAVESLDALASACSPTAHAAHTAQAAASDSLPPQTFSATATLLARVPAMHASSEALCSDASAGDSAVGSTSLAAAGGAAERVARVSPLEGADVAAAEAEGAAGWRMDTEAGALLATLLKNVPGGVSDAHVAVHTAEVAAFGSLPHTAPDVAPLWVRPLQCFTERPLLVPLHVSRIPRSSRRSSFTQ